MSRIGKKPVSIPKGIEVKCEGSKLVFKKGGVQKELDTHGRVAINITNSEIILSPLEGVENSRAFWGTYRALANNIVEGLDKGFQKQLEINGVGYRASVKGSILELSLGFSHPINFEIPKGVEITVDKNIIIIKGNDKQEVGQIAANIRGFRPPEPYKGKGIKYVDEKIIRKAGKAAKK